MPIVLLVWGFSALASGVYVSHTLNSAYNRKAKLAREEEETKEKGKRE